jgi:hypothetical protein
MSEPTSFACPDCAYQFNPSDPRWAGPRIITCPGCRGQLRVPRPGGVPGPGGEAPDSGGVLACLGLVAIVGLILIIIASNIWWKN